MSMLGDYEPIGSREGAVIAAIAAAFAPAGTITRLNTRELTAVGPAVAPRLINRILIQQTMRQALTQRQYIILWHRFVRDRTQQGTAEVLHIRDRNTIAVDEHAGLQTLVRLFWNEPGYTTPPRVRRTGGIGELLHRAIGGTAA